MSKALVVALLLFAALLPVRAQSTASVTGPIFGYYTCGVAGCTARICWNWNMNPATPNVGVIPIRYALGNGKFATCSAWVTWTPALRPPYGSHDCCGSYNAMIADLTRTAAQYGITYSP